MTTFLVKLIAAFEMLGGLAGVGIVFWQVVAAPDGDPAITLAPIAAALYGFSLVAGLGLWTNKSFGLKASMVVQILQMPKLLSPQIAFMFSVGIDFWVHYVWTNEFSLLGFEFKLPAFHQIFVNVESAPFLFGVSITALLSLAILGRYRPRIIPATEPPDPPSEWNTTKDVRSALDPEGR